jgi:hypothetical protein
MIETVYQGRDNRNRIAIRENNVPLSLADASRVILYLDGYGEIDSASHADLFDWDDGVLEFAVGSLSIPIGDYRASVIVFDALHPNGQVLIHAESQSQHPGETLTIRVLDSE